MKYRRPYWIASLTLVMSVALGTHAQEMLVPVEAQYQLFTRILSFDRNLKTRTGDTLVIGILYQSQFRASHQTKHEFLTAFEQSPQKEIGGIPLKCLPIDLRQPDQLPALVGGQRLAALYVSPVRAFDIGALSAATRSAQVLTLTGVPEYIGRGIAVGIDMKGDRPTIVINLPAARAEGADFSSHLLKLARIVQ